MVGEVHQTDPLDNYLNAHSSDKAEHCQQQGEKVGNASDQIDKENACPKYLDPFLTICFAELPTAQTGSQTMNSKHAHSSFCSRSHQNTMQLMQSDTVVNVKRDRAFEMDWIITGSSDEKNLI